MYGSSASIISANAIMMADSVINNVIIIIGTAYTMAFTTLAHPAFAPQKANKLFQEHNPILIIPDGENVLNGLPELALIVNPPACAPKLVKY